MGAAAVLLLLLGGGIGFGIGNGAGSGAAAMAPSSAVEEPAKEEVQAESTPEMQIIETTPAPAVQVVIQVEKSSYLLGGTAVSLAEIEACIDAAAENTTFLLEDRYASAKAWDEINALFVEKGIGVVEE